MAEEVLALRLKMVDNATEKLSHALNIVDSLAQKIEALAGFGANAVQAFAGWEELKIRLEAITGSADRAAKKLEFVRKLAGPSPFTTEQLAEAATRLEALGLAAEDTLGTVSKLGAAFGADQERLMMLVRLMGQLKTGQTPEADTMGAFGMTKEGLSKFGMKFDAKGSLMSSGKEALEAFDRYVNAKYGSILQRMSGSTSARLANLRDSWQQTMIRVGGSVAEHFLPIIERVMGKLDKFGETGQLEAWVERMIAGAEKLAKAFAIAAPILAGVAAMILLTKSFIMAAAFATALKVALGDVKVLAMTAVALTAAAFVTGLGMAWVSDQFRGDKKGGWGTDETKGKDPTLGGPGAKPEDGPPAMNHAAEIAKNTRQTAVNTQKALDFRKFAIGGGELGAFGPGILPGMMGPRGGATRGGGATININVDNGDAARSVYDTLISLKRRGLI